MLLYLGLYCLIVLLCWRQIPLYNLSQFLLARFKSRNIEFCNLIVYLITMMLLYRDQSRSEILLCLITEACAIWNNSYFAFGSYARFKPQNIEFCNLIVYLIIIMLLYLRLYYLIEFLC